MRDKRNQCGNPRPDTGKDAVQGGGPSSPCVGTRQRRGKQFYTIKEVVSTGLRSRQTPWRLMRSGELGYVKIGTRVLIPHSELASLVQSRYHKAVR